jgi:hypothetical protein
MNAARPFVLGVLTILFASQAYAASCECTVTVGNQNRWIWGSWALECNGHKGHGDCPTTNIDTAHSPGTGAMVGKLIVEARSDNSVRQRWTKTFSDDHVTAFKGPIMRDGQWTWTNVCSCDAYNQSGCSASQWWNQFAPMYSGPLNDQPYVYQGKSTLMKLPYACGDSRQDLAVFEQMEENDPWSANDGMGQIGVAFPAQSGTRNYTVWAEHHEPAMIGGTRTHAGWAGGNFGAELVVTTSCVSIGAPASQYVGCFTDDENRALPADLGGGHTVQSCADAARGAGYAYAGLQWYGQCFGGTAPAYSQVGDEECNTPCDADPSQMCGGAWRNSIYATGL